MGINLFTSQHRNYYIAIEESRDMATLLKQAF